MEQVKLSSKGQIAIPKLVREALNLIEGSSLTLEVRGQEIVLSKGAGWRKLQGAGGDLMNGGNLMNGGDLMNSFTAFKAAERAREDSRT